MSGTSIYPNVSASQYAADRANERCSRLQCRCGTRRGVEIVKRDTGRSKSYRAKCPGCGKESDPTFYLERLTDKWNAVATR